MPVVFQSFEHTLPDGPIPGYAKNWWMQGLFLGLNHQWERHPRIDKHGNNNNNYYIDRIIGYIWLQSFAFLSSINGLFSMCNKSPEGGLT